MAAATRAEDRPPRRLFGDAIQRGGLFVADRVFEPVDHLERNDLPEPVFFHHPIGENAFAPTRLGLAKMLLDEVAARDKTDVVSNQFESLWNEL